MNKFLYQHSLLARLVTLISLLLAVVWFARSPDWEPAIASIGLFALLAFEEFFERKAKFGEADTKLFQEFLTTLPSSGSVEFLRDHDMAVSFEWSSLSDVNNFYRKWNDAEHEFHDPKIEAKRKELYVKISTFLNFVSLNTFPNQQYDRQSVPK